MTDEETTMSELPTDAIKECVDAFYDNDSFYEPEATALGKKAHEQLQALVKRIAELKAKQGDKQ